jgi:hypothetical protein
VVLVVLTPIAELLTDTRADFDAHLIRDGDVPTVEESVQIGAK